MIYLLFCLFFSDKVCADISAKKDLMQLKARHAESVSIASECPALDENVIIINATQSGLYIVSNLSHNHNQVIFARL